MASLLIAPKLFANCSATSLNTAVLLCAILNFSADNPFAAANFLVAISSLKMTPSSSSSSGSAFVTPRINLLNESVKSRPNATEAFLAPSASATIWFCENPAAVAIAVCCAAV